MKKAVAVADAESVAKLPAVTRCDNLWDDFAYINHNGDMSSRPQIYDAVTPAVLLFDSAECSHQLHTNRRREIVTWIITVVMASAQHSLKCKQGQSIQSTVRSLRGPRLCAVAPWWKVPIVSHLLKNLENRYGIMVPRPTPLRKGVAAAMECSQSFTILHLGVTKLLHKILFGEAKIRC